MLIKRFLVFIIVSILLLSIAACTGKQEYPEGVVSNLPSEKATNAASSSPVPIGDEEVMYPYTFTDSTGREVTINKKPEKVAILFSSYADIWMTAGGTTQITVGESIERGFADNSAVLVDGGAGHTTIDLETLVAAKPDIVIATADFECQADAVAFCSGVGIPSAAFRVECFNDYLSVLKIFCSLTGKIERYNTFGEQVKARIEGIKLKVLEHMKTNERELNVLFVRSGSSAKSTKAKTAADNFVCAMLDELGTRNIADTASSLTGELSMEVILENNPDFLFITTMGDENASKDYMNSLLKSDGWKELTCVNTGNYVYLPKELFHFKPNARWAEAYEYLAKLLYPELDFE